MCQSIRKSVFLFTAWALIATTNAQIAIRGEQVHTMAGPTIKDGVVIIRDGKIVAVGPVAEVAIPSGMKVLTAKVVTPGLIDAHATVGLTGITNQKGDQDQIEHSSPIQPELRALDAFNIDDPLIDWVRSFGVTTVHTGHAPGELISGQTMIAKLIGNSVDDAVLVPTAAVACTLAERARKSDGKSPGTRAKMMSLLRQELIKAREYQARRATAADDKKPDRDLRLEVLTRVLAGELPLMITANRVQDIANALRLQQEFGFKLWLDGAVEAYLMIDEIKKAGVPVIVHPSMQRAVGEAKNQTFENAARLRHADIPIALQSGFEAYVPKVRVVLFEAALTAANGLSFDQALETITSGAAKILGIDNRVGSLEIGKDGDVALYDGDPFEYTTHCVAVVINGRVVSDKPR